MDRRRRRLNVYRRGLLYKTKSESKSVVVPEAILAELA